MPSNLTYTDDEAVTALLTLLGNTKWEVVCYAHGYAALWESPADPDIKAAARIAYKHGTATLKQAVEFMTNAATAGFLAGLPPRTRIGSAENPITKLFPATITEQRFIESLERIGSTRSSIKIEDNRGTGHTLADFTLKEQDLELPINVKNAGTRFENALALVGLQPNDCLPIPAYKAHAALVKSPNLLYAVSPDYELIGVLNDLLPTLLNRNEQIVWDILNKSSGSLLGTAEDQFVFSTVRQYWQQIKPAIQHNPFYAISARKSVRILQTQPQRTPGIGLKAWGTGASGEVNVHISLSADATLWDSIEVRIIDNGLKDIVDAINRRRQEWVYDPEI